MGYNIENEKLLRSEDENVGEVDHLLKEMAKEDGKKTGKFKNDFVDESDDNDDDMSEDEELDDDVQNIYNSHIDDSTKYGYRLSQIWLVVFLINIGTRNPELIYFGMTH
jgi:hypothetical protein